MDSIPGVAQGLSQFPSCRNQRGRSGSFRCSGKLAIGERCRRSTRCVVLPSITVEDSDFVPSPPPSPKRSLDSVELEDGVERPKKRLSVPSLFEGHGFLELAPE